MTQNLGHKVTTETLRQMTYEALRQMASEDKPGQRGIWQTAKFVGFRVWTNNRETLTPQYSHNKGQEKLFSAVRRALDFMETQGLVVKAGFAPRIQFTTRSLADKENAQHANERDIRAKEKYGEPHQIQELIQKAADELRNEAARGDTRPANLAATLRTIQEATRDLRRMIERNPKS